MASAYLVLDDGRIFEGESWGASGETFGEAVFATGMTGYQETLTDPSYHKQVVVMTAPHIGNTGVNPHDHESEKIEEGIVCIQGVDTRAITRHLRDRGSMRVGIFSGLEMTREEMVIAVRKSPTMVGANLVADVSTKSPYVVPAIGEKRFTVVALDLGIKAATPRALSERGVEVHVLPYNSSFEEIKSYSPDGVFLSNGPGDPASMDKTVEIVREILGAEIPIFGICFGHQILGRALGFSTYKLQFGHRGINQPVIDRSTGKVEITAHNHGFALQAPTEGTFTTVYGPGEVTHLSLNDGVVEGLALLERPAFSVQYHPEAAAGPHDASYLFDRVIDLMAGQWVIL
ncbi:MAG: glutamine-hydrolyzing carbamoyl-phosphate synthase small subunit [Actinobacteria bacterium]|nr:glutamine-hydrolyzing carbamoyl-phosphate synthase small subunit [Actinomycetota bacterium]